MTEFFIISETKETLKIYVKSYACYMNIELPVYCNPQKKHMWTKAIPGTTSFEIPTEKKNEFEQFLKNHNYKLNKM